MPPVLETPTVCHLPAAGGAPSQTPPSIPAWTPSYNTSLKRKRPGVLIDEIEKFLEVEPKDYKAAWEELKARINQPIRNNVKTLSPSALKSTREALRLFALTKSDINPFKEIKSVEVPQYLKDNITRIFTVTNSSESHSEAFSRSVLDQILISSLYEESGKGSASIRHADHGHPYDPATGIQEDPAKLELLHEMPLSSLVMHEGESKLLLGSADYSIWYDSARKNTMATNLLIIEAKREGDTDHALSQLIAYMGIVHSTRKKESKQNSVVYGIASDGGVFRFCRIDNDGVFTKSFLMEWAERPDQIFSIIRSMIRAAALSSPSTTPIKDPQQRRIVLASFGSPDHSQKFNHPLDGLEFFYEGDEGTEDIEIVHLW